jgi:hypothetical protein
MTFTHSLSQIPSEKQILKYLKNTVFGKSVCCPDCHRQVYVQELKKNRLWRCRKCRNKFSITSVNWLRGMKLSHQHLWALIWARQNKMNVQQVKVLPELSIPTIRRYYALFRNNLNLDYDIVLEGKVQMDEMFVNGAFIIGAKDIKRKKIKLTVINKKSPTKSDAMELIINHINPDPFFKLMVVVFIVVVKDYGQ